MKVTRILRLTLGVVLVAFLLWWLDWRKVLPTLLEARGSDVAAAILIGTFGIVACAWKWHRLMAAQRLSPGFWIALACYWSGNSFSNYLPGNVGGDVVRLVMTRRFGRTPEVAASIVVERLTGLAMLLVLAGAGLWARPAYFAAVGALVPLALLALQLQFWCVADRLWPGWGA